MNFHQDPIKHIKQVVLKVNDLESMSQFYKDIFGFQVIKVNDKHIELGANKQESILILEQLDQPDESQALRIGLYHVAYLLPSRADLASFTYHLIKHNIQFGAGDHHVSEALYFNDIEGNGIEVYADRDYKGWQWHANQVSMTTEAVDFDDLLQVAQKPFTQAPAGTLIGHVHLQVSDLEANEAFYHQGLGFDIVHRYGDHALFLSDEGYHHHVAMNTWGGGRLVKPTTTSRGLKTMSLSISDEAERTQILRQLQALGYQPQADKDHLSIVDPNGIIIKIEK